MQTAEKFITDNVEVLIKQNEKLQRIAAVAAQVLEAYGDKFASYNEKQYVLEKLDETIQ